MQPCTLLLKPRETSPAKLPECSRICVRPGTAWTWYTRPKRGDWATTQVYDPHGMQDTRGALPRQGSSRVKQVKPTSGTTRRPSVPWSVLGSRVRMAGSASTKCSLFGFQGAE